MPGLIIERLSPRFLDKTLKDVEKKIILVTGTNGKTTTTKMLVQGLRSQSRVVTNETGSNMTRGLIAALINDMTSWGSLRQTDWFVFEMDEAYAPIFTHNLKPRMLIALNVLRDQLDRYGEIDKTANLIERAAMSCDEAIINSLDPLLRQSIDRLTDQGVLVQTFGAKESLFSKIYNEQSTHGKAVDNGHGADLVLEDAREGADGQILSIKQARAEYIMSIPVIGFHNALNATAVMTALINLSPDIGKSLEAIKQMPTPFGRGERLRLKGKDITVALVKNPSGFMTNLDTFVKKAKPSYVLFAVNDNFADGRDVSWLWDVQFKDNIDKNTTIVTSGSRAYDMALRLKHDDLKADVVSDIRHAVARTFKDKSTDVVIIPTYTALYEVRSALKKYGKVPRIW